MHDASGLTPPTQPPAPKPARLGWDFHLRFMIFFRVMKLIYWAQRTAAKKAVRLKQLCRSLLDAEVRQLHPDALQIGEDDRLDMVVELVARELLGIEVLSELLAVRGDSRVAELTDLASKSSAVSEVVSRYHATDAFFANILKDEARRTEQLKAARSAVPETVPYDMAALYREHGKTVKRLSLLRKELAERSAIKLSASAEGVAAIIAIITGLFLVAGFLQARYFYARLGVDVTLYFSASDYLSASMEQIRSGAFAAFFAFMALLGGMRAASLRPRLQHLALEKTRRRGGYIVAGLAAVTCLAAGYSIYIGQPNFGLLNLAGSFICYWIAKYVAVTYFRNPLAALAALVGVLTFAMHVGLSAYERSERLLSGSSPSAKVQRVHFKDASPVISGELFGANNSYYFMYERTTRMTNVVPRDRVSQIDIVQTQ